MKILFVASEGLPFSKTGGLADVIEALPKVAGRARPRSDRAASAVPQYARQSRSPCRALRFRWATACVSRELWRAGSLHGVYYYFVDDPEYFDREQLYGVAGKDYPDNAERFAEFCGAAIEFCKQRLDARCDPLPRLANGPRSRAAANAVRER